jgi:hypothetical protein
MLILIFSALLFLLIWWIITIIKYIPEEYDDTKK